MSAPVILEAAGLRVEFTCRGDRFAHRVSVNDAAAFVPLLDSLEGTPDDDWPASPPWQEVHCEQRPGDVQVALAVGKAGKSHWSASFELDPSGSLAVDVACRTGAAPIRLGSTYLLHGPVEFESPRARARIAQRWILQPGADVAACAIELGVSPASLSVRPIFDPTGNWPRTIRWRYTITEAGNWAMWPRRSTTGRHRTTRYVWQVAIRRGEVPQIAGLTGKNYLTKEHCLGYF